MLTLEYYNNMRAGDWHSSSVAYLQVFNFFQKFEKFHQEVVF